MFVGINTQDEEAKIEEARRGVLSASQGARRVPIDPVTRRDR